MDTIFSMKTATQLSKDLQTSIAMISRIASGKYGPKVGKKYGSSWMFTKDDERKIAAKLKEKRGF
jgi:hypothetical protein